MKIITKYEQIDKQQWAELVKDSETATWFQTEEAYEFYASLPELFYPFVVAVISSASPKERERLVGVVVGYVTREKNALKQFATRRAIIIGGPMLANDTTEEEVASLLKGVRSALCAKEKGVLERPIYIETRNFHDYSRWRSVFEQCGCKYEEHLNFHVDTSSQEIIETNLGKNRKRDIKFSFRDGAKIVEHPTIEQVREYYAILKKLYTTKVKTPLFPLFFFENLYACPASRFLLVELNGEIIGGTVCVCLDNKAMYEWFVCGRDGEWKSIFPSSVATYAGICYAAANGYPIFDMMGAGTPNEAYGVRDFKARFGGKEVEHGRFVRVFKPLLFAVGKIGVKILKSL